MADSKKNNVVVVVLVLLGVLSVSHGFTQDLQQYTNEVARRSFNVMEYFKEDSRLMKFASPAFSIITFFVAFYQVWLLIISWIPMLGGLFGGGGWGQPQLGATLIGAPPVEVEMVRNGEQREQRLLESIDERVKAAVASGISEFENELKKK